jgi:hypothetical protein
MEVVRGAEVPRAPTTRKNPEQYQKHSAEVFLFDCHRCQRTGHIARHCALARCKHCRGFVGHLTVHCKNNQ